MPSFGGLGFSSGMQGFETPMTRAEAASGQHLGRVSVRIFSDPGRQARQILNLSSMAPNKEAVREAHRRPVLLLTR